LEGQEHRSSAWNLYARKIELLLKKPDIPYTYDANEGSTTPPKNTTVAFVFPLRTFAAEPLPPISEPRYTAHEAKRGGVHGLDEPSMLVKTANMG